MPLVHDEKANGNNATNFKVSNHYHSQPSKIRVICVGAGAAGLLVAYKMRKALTDYELVCYEKYAFHPIGHAVCKALHFADFPPINRNPSVGGTWYENRYPGCQCSNRISLAMDAS